MQLSLRIPDELAALVRSHAERAGHSTNGWITMVLRAAVDPELAGSEAARMRERLARAGLLAEPQAQARRPHGRDVSRARRAAGQGTPLAEIVSRERG